MVLCSIDKSVLVLCRLDVMMPPAGYGARAATALGPLRDIQWIQELGSLLAGYQPLGVVIRPREPLAAAELLLRPEDDVVGLVLPHLGCQARVQQALCLLEAHDGTSTWEGLAVLHVVAIVVQPAK